MLKLPMSSYLSTHKPRQPVVAANQASAPRSRRGWRPVALAGLMLLAVAASARAEQVAHEYLGLTVIGNLELAPAKSLQEQGAVLLVHDTLGHHTDATMSRLQAALTAKGVNSVAISLSLGLNQRKAAFDCTKEHDHRHGDASDEIVAWVEWLQAKGARRVSIVGHGRGAAQAALSVIERSDLAVHRLILANPSMMNSLAAAQRFLQQYGQPLAPVLEQARKLVEDGDGDTLQTVPGFLSCRDARTTAAAFVDYYGGDNRQDIIALLPELKQRTLLVVAGADAVNQEFEKTLSISTLTPNLTRQTLTTADAGFSGSAASQLADLVVVFANAD
jgi:pimeloyl-ACP methyl ester carboxylesterase